MASDEVGPSTAEETMDDSAGDETVPKILHELDNSSFFQDVLPANMEGTKPCIFLELCAGSAKLSAAVLVQAFLLYPLTTNTTDTHHDANLFSLTLHNHMRGIKFCFCWITTLLWHATSLRPAEPAAGHGASLWRTGHQDPNP